MTTLSTFFHVLKNTYSSTNYYKDVLKAPFSFSLKYFVFFSFLISLIVTVFISISLLIPLNEFLRRFPQVLVNVYPAELEVKIEKGEVTTNVPQPYTIPIDRLEDTFKQLENDVQGARTDEIKNVLVIDTNATVEDLAAYQTYALLTKNFLSFYKDNGRIETISLEDIDNITINQSLVKGLINKILPYLQWLSLLIVPFLFVGSFLFITLSQLLYLLIAAFILFLLAKIFSYQLTYAKAYQIDLHVTTIVFPLFLVLGFFNVNIQFPFLRLIIFSVIGLYIVNSLKKSISKSRKLKR